MQCPPLALKSNLSHKTRMAPEDQATLSELFSDNPVDGAITGFTLAHLRQSDKPLLWIQDRLSLREAGRPYLPGLPVDFDVIHVEVSKPVDVLWAMEEGLRCSALCAVIGEVWGDPPALDFTATKRLALRAEAQNVPAFLMRRAATANLSAARLRWRVASLPSQAKPYDSRAPGAPLWQASLFRARWRTPGEWVASHDADGLHFGHGIENNRDHGISHSHATGQATA